MSEELINNIKSEEAVETIYSSIYRKDDKTYVNYIVVLDIENVVDNIELLKNIVANMEILKTLLSKGNVYFSYTVITAEELSRKSTKKELSNVLAKSSVIYNKYNNDLDIDNNEGKGRV